MIEIYCKANEAPKKDLLTEKEALLKAIEWLDNIKKSGDKARDIMIDTQPKGIGLHALYQAAGLSK